MRAPRPAVRVPSAETATHTVRSGPLATEGGAGGCSGGVVEVGGTVGEDGTGDDGGGDGDPWLPGVDTKARTSVNPRRTPNATSHAMLSLFLRAVALSAMRPQYSRFVLAIRSAQGPRGGSRSGTERQRGPGGVEQAVRPGVAGQRGPVAADPGARTLRPGQCQAVGVHRDQGVVVAQEHRPISFG